MELPRAVVGLIAGFCDIRDLASIAATCRMWADVPSDPLVCAALYERFFGGALWNAGLKPPGARLAAAVAAQRSAGDATAQLCWLLRNGHSAGAARFLAGRSDDVADFVEPLLEAVRSGSVADVDALLHAGARLNAQNAQGRGVLHVAAWERRADMAEALLARGADPRLREANYGQTAMHVAAARDAVHVMEAIHAAAPALAAAPDRDGWTPAHVAARRHSTGALALLSQW